MCNSPHTVAGSKRGLEVLGMHCRCPNTISQGAWHPWVTWANDSPPQVSCIRTTSPICRESWGAPFPWKLYIAVKWKRGTAWWDLWILRITAPPCCPWVYLTPCSLHGLIRPMQKPTAYRRSQCRPSLAAKGLHSLTKPDPFLAWQGSYWYHLP